jgi:hypothetical protein
MEVIRQAIASMSNRMPPAISSKSKASLKSSGLAPGGRICCALRGPKASSRRMWSLKGDCLIVLCVCSRLHLGCCAVGGGLGCWLLAVVDFFAVGAE